MEQVESYQNSLGSLRLAQLLARLLCLKNRDMITGLLSSPLLKKVEDIANNAINKGI